MGKLKTHKGVAKRFKVTAGGKLKHHKIGRRHLMNSKTAKRGRALRRPVTLSKVNEGLIKRLLPYCC
jgi:large subunit ribosomal protein L35